MITQSFPRASFCDKYLRELTTMPASRMSIREAKSLVRAEAFRSGYQGMHLCSESAWKTETYMSDRELAYALKVAMKRLGAVWESEEPFILTVGNAAVVIDPQGTQH